MDVEMKPTNGLVATQEICRLCSTARVIMVTQHDDEEFFVLATRFGACACFRKEDLGAMVRFISDSSLHRINAVANSISDDRNLFAQ
jgi:DNA-binding NarL/FixJ family response regulator